MSFQNKYKISICMILLEILLVVSGVLWQSGLQNPSAYFLFSAMIVVLMTGLLYGTVWGLLFSMLSVFVYGSILIYQGFMVPVQGVRSRDEIITLFDYLWLVAFPVTGFSAGFLGNTIIEMIKVAENRKDYQEKYDCLDIATQLKNARMFYSDLKKEMEKTVRYSYKFSVLFIKVKYLNEFRSIFGIHQEELLLKKVSEVMNDSLRLSDETYRIDDSVFAVILPETDILGTEVTKDRIRTKAKLAKINDERNREKIFALEFQMGALQYDGTIENPIEFKEMVEKELRYDV